MRHQLRPLLNRGGPLLVLLLALTLQLTYQADLRATFPDSFTGQPFCGVDALTHHDRAVGLMSGRYPGDGPWLFIPLYPLFLATIYGRLDFGYYLPVLLQTLLNLTTFAALYAIGRYLFSRITGLLAMLALALYAPFAYYLPCYDQVLLTVPFFTLTIFLLLKFHARGQLMWLLLAAVTLTVSALSRPTVLILAPAVVIWLFLYRSSFKQFVLHTVCFGAVIGLLISPITWHNYRTGGEFILLSKNGAINLFTGNNPDAYGLDSLAHAQSQPAVLRHIELQPRRRSGETTYLAEVGRYIRDQPGDWLALTTIKTWYWFGEADKPLISPFFPQAIADSALLRRLPVEWQAAALTAFLGLLLVRGRNRQSQMLIWLIYGFFSLASIIFFIQLRFRLPFVPFVLLYAVALVAQGGRWIKFAPRRFWLTLFILLAAYPFLPHVWLFIVIFVGLGLGSAILSPRQVVAYRWAALAVWSYLVVGAFGVQAQAAATDVSQTIGHYLGPRLVGNGILGQTFEMDCANFDHLSIQFGTFDDRHDQPVTLAIATDTTAQTIVVSQEIDGSDIRDYQWYDFTFSPLPDSQGRPYFFFISSPTSTPDNSLTARGYTDTPVDFYRSGQAYAGAIDSLQPTEADFAFVATCRQTFWERLTAGINRMVRQQIFGINRPTVYWTILSVHLILLIVALSKLATFLFNRSALNPQSNPHKI